MPGAGGGEAAAEVAHARRGVRRGEGSVAVDGSAGERGAGGLGLRLHAKLPILLVVPAGQNSSEFFLAVEPLSKAPASVLSAFPSNSVIFFVFFSFFVVIGVVVDG